MNQVQFVRTCILSGCDYLDSLPGIGLKTAVGYVLRFRDYDDAERLLKFILSKKNHRPSDPEQYIDDFHAAEKTFFHQLVFDPRSNDITRLNPIHSEKYSELEKEVRSLSSQPFISMDLARVLADAGKESPSQPSQLSSSLQPSQSSQAPPGFAHQIRDSSDPMEIEDDLKFTPSKEDISHDISKLRMLYGSSQTSSSSSKREIDENDLVEDQQKLLDEIQALSPKEFEDEFSVDVPVTPSGKEALTPSSQTSQGKVSIISKLQNARAMITPARTSSSSQITSKKETLSQKLARKAEKKSNDWIARYSSSQNMSSQGAKQQDQENQQPSTPPAVISSVSAFEKDACVGSSQEDDDIAILEDPATITPQLTRKRPLLSSSGSMGAKKRKSSGGNPKKKTTTIGVDKSPNSANKIISYFQRI
eukprot:TRINITY_DN10668_c0_g1_i2.p1 TRINITY_DN10668_c0_g1~~TRINITY_DN10668_c0_g1_i2.p1  ORF type:complete len:420 (+),score=100.58 TRINITY_DN10668_c0_g1_i2:225-1484(+)